MLFCFQALISDNHSIKKGFLKLKFLRQPYNKFMYGFKPPENGIGFNQNYQTKRPKQQKRPLISSRLK